MPLGARIAGAIVTCLLLAGCDPEYQELVVRECIHDGQPQDYCECVSQGMRQALDANRYALFTDFILLGGTGRASPDDILRLMEKHGLSPEQLTEARNAMDDALPAVDRRCR
jgi:hypothetical protein